MLNSSHHKLGTYKRAKELEKWHRQLALLRFMKTSLVGLDPQTSWTEPTFSANLAPFLCVIDSPHLPYMIPKIAWHENFDKKLFTLFLTSGSITDM